MATLVDSNFPNLVNIAKRTDPNGSISEVANVLSKKLRLLDDIPWMEGNLPTGHRITQAANALPSGGWRKLNAGVSASKGETSQFDETCGILQTESRIDVDVAKLNGNAAAYRASEDLLFAEGLAQQFATGVFYESAITNPERLHGLSPRYPALSGYTSSAYTLRGAGTANDGVDNHSVWLINWKPRKVYGIYPKGSQAGLVREDKGEVYVTDPNDSTKQLWAYLTKFQWKCGIAVEDYRYCVRMQWDPSDTTNFPADFSKKSLVFAMQNMLNTVFDSDDISTMRFYMSRTTKARLDGECTGAQANLLEYLSDGGMRLGYFMGVPLRVTDALVAETAIV
jgi:hypothetical protein